MQEVCSVIDPLIKTESMMPLQTVILPANQQMNPINGGGPPMQNGGQTHLNMHNPQQQQPQLPGKLNQNCDNKTRVPDNSYWMPADTGYINSQPSMAEFLTHLGPDSSPKMDQSYGNSSDDPVPEYPWMKEKKTARKGNQAQSKLSSCFYFLFCLNLSWWKVNRVISSCSNLLQSNNPVKEVPCGLQIWC